MTLEERKSKTVLLHTIEREQNVITFPSLDHVAVPKHAQHRKGAGAGQFHGLQMEAGHIRILYKVRGGLRNALCQRA